MFLVERSKEPRTRSRKQNERKSDEFFLRNKQKLLLLLFISLSLFHFFSWTAWKRRKERKTRGERNGTGNSLWRERSETAANNQPKAHRR
jgi:hypothetical protein